MIGIRSAVRKEVVFGPICTVGYDAFDFLDLKKFEDDGDVICIDEKLSEIFELEDVFETKGQ